jgi:vacuolar protein sorting-associated protein 35
LIGSLCEVSILDKENYLTFVNNLISSTTKISKRSDQCVATLACTNLYLNKNIEDHAKAKETLNKAKRFAEYSMTIPQNLHLFVVLLNKYLYFIERGVSFIDASMINDVVDVIKNYIHTIKSENPNATFLPEVEKYFEKTIENIQTRSKDKPIFQEVVLHS